MITFRQDQFLKQRLAEDMTDDQALCVAARNLLDEQHMTAGYFSKGFDVAFLNTRLAMYDEKLLQPKLHLDPIWFFKGWRGLKPMSSKMKHVAKFLGLEQKPDVDPEVWLKARGGNKKAMDEIVERCEADVRITRAIAEKAMDMQLIKNIQRYP